jgi:hypothetical protein
MGYSDGEAHTQTAQCYAVGRNGRKDPDGVLKITYSWKTTNQKVYSVFTSAISIKRTF